MFFLTRWTCDICSHTHTYKTIDTIDEFIILEKKKKNCFNFCVRHKLKFLVWKRTGWFDYVYKSSRLGDKQLRINDKNVCLCFQLTVPQFSGRCSYHDKYYPLQLWRNFNLSIHPSTVFIKGQAEILNVCSEIASVFMSQTTEIESLQDFSCMHSISEKNQQCESNDHPRPFMLVTGRHLGKKVLRSDDGTTKVVFLFELL